MESLPLTGKTFFFTGGTKLPLFSSERRTTTTTVYLNQRKNYKLFASPSREEEQQQQRPQLDNDDLAELKFGRLIGEDPKLTLAKIMGTKANPDASYLDIEKSFYNKKKKGKIVEVEQLPFEVQRPKLARGLQFKPDDKKIAVDIKKPDQTQSKVGNVRKSSVPNVILRKPTVYKEDEDEDSSFKLRIRPNLSLTMRSGLVKEKFSDMTLLRKPQSIIPKDTDSAVETGKEESVDEVGNWTLLEQPRRPIGKKEEVPLEMRKEEPPDDASNLTLLEQPHRPIGKKEEVPLEMRKEEPADEASNLTLLEQPHRPIGKKEEVLLEMRKEEPADEAINLTLLEQPHRPSGEKEELQLEMQKEEPADEASNLTLLEQPHKPIGKKEEVLLEMRKEEPADEAINLTLLEQPHRPSGEKEELQLEMQKEEATDDVCDLTLLEQPHGPSGEKEEQFGDAGAIVAKDGLKQYELRQPDVQREPADLNQLSDLNSVVSKTELSVAAAIKGKPKRLDQNAEQISKSVGGETTTLDPRSQRNNEELRNPVDESDFQEIEDAYWTKAEDLIKTGDREYVDLVSCNTKGFIVSFGTLVGFLPYRNLLSRWKFIAFESWLRQKGLDPSMYKQNLGTATSYDSENRNLTSNSPSHVENGGKIEDQISPDMKLEDLLRIYDQEKIKFLSSFIGQKINAYVFLVDRKLKKLIFSLRPKENEELSEKKKNLMARLQVGDIVKCCIQKITYFGIFVEVEGVSALIHQSELSWDASLNPSKYYKIDQVVEAKVHQLNTAHGRIFLSLKEVTPDPLMGSLESVVGDHETFDGRLEAAATDAEWPEVESLINELQKIEGIESVSKGRFFKSPGLAPTFQVLMASIFENQYKLLARSGNRIQEVMVQTSLEKERMKSAIMTCANRVE